MIIKKKSSMLFILALIVFSLIGTIFVASAEDEDSNLWITIQKSSPELVFSSAWREVNNEMCDEGYFMMTQYKQSPLEITFTGTSFSWVGVKGPFGGKADIYIDGEKVAANIDCYNKEIMTDIVLFSTKGLKAETHTVKIVPTETKNEDAFNSFVPVDYVKFIPTVNEVINRLEAKIKDAESYQPAVGEILKPYYTEKDKEALEAAVSKGKDISQEEASQENIIELNKTLKEITNEAAFPDISMNCYTAEVRGAPRWVPGKLGKAVLFDGRDDFLGIFKRGLLDGVSELTVEAWIMPLGRGSFIAANYQGFMLRHKKAKLTNSKGEQVCNIKHDNPENGVWTHLAVVYDGEDAIFYKNGQVENESRGIANIGQMTLNGTNGFSAIAAEFDGPGDFDPDFRGVIDEVRIWSTARSQNELLAYCNSRLSGDEEGLEAYWTFDETK